jgi:hypothetical protein
VPQQALILVGAVDLAAPPPLEKGSIMAGMFEFDWWRKLVDRATDEELEQAVSGLGNEIERSSPAQLAVAMQIMHDEAVRELAQRSRDTIAAVRQLGSPPPLH